MAFHPHHAHLTRPALRRAAISQAVALLLLGSGIAHAQQPTLKPVTISERNAPPVADVTGFGEVPLRELPLSATVVGRDRIDATATRRLSDLAGNSDASITDAYNSPGYWDYLTVRGFVIDNRYNYRREGLPISAETVIPLDNKERIEILKGTSGLQAGTSAPGGLVNYVVKRPTQQPLREVRLEAASRASVLGAVDISSRFGEQNAFGLRVNAAAERLRPTTRNLDGDRHLLAVAGDWRLTRDSIVEAEFEWSRRTQPSQAAYSILGSTLPPPPDPRLNLANQAWGQPSEFDAFTGTLRFEQALGSGWSWSAQAGRQDLRTDDRLAFPFGCAAEGNYDRFCSDGTFDFYDFRSENEKRVTNALAFNLKGGIDLAGVRHDLKFGVLTHTQRLRFDRQAYNFVGIGNIAGTAVVPADPTLTGENTHRDERTLELSVQDAVHWNDRFSTWAGVRHTRLQRESVRTDGSRPTDYRDDLTTPWLALGYKLGGGMLAYASWGQGVESQVVPNRAAQYTNAGVALPALKSRQWEFGLKGGSDTLDWQLAWFNIKRPMSNLDACSRLGLTPCTGAYDGSAVHQGLEANTQWVSGPWRLGASATLLDAERVDSAIEPAVNGQRPTNVPRYALRLQAGWRPAALPGLELTGLVSREGRRAILPDNSLELPAWTRVDAALRYQTTTRGVPTTWTVGIDNVFDRRYWKESPYQFGHVYLYPGTARALRVAFTAAL